MASLRPIDYPKHLDIPTISEHELARMSANMTPDQVALAKDWNIIRNKQDWMIRQYIDDRNVLVEHDIALTNLNRVYWLAGVILMPGNFWMLAKVLGWI